MSIRVQSLIKEYKKTEAAPGVWGQIQNLFYRRYSSFRAVDQISFEIAPGNCVGLLGANGAGKTTLIKMLSGLLVPSSGSAEVLGFTPWKRPNEFLKQIGVVMGQKQQLWIDISAYENLRLNQVLYSMTLDDFHARLKVLAELLEVEHLINTQIRKLSLGEKMKMELLAAFLHRPRMLFLDEPTIGLDVIAQSKIREFIRTLVRDEGVTVLLTSHYMRDLEELCPRVLLIQHGKLIHDGPLEGILGELGNLRKIFWKAADGGAHSNGYQKTEEGEWCLETQATELPTKLREILDHFPRLEDLRIDSMPIEEGLKKLL